ncbi:MAG: type II toxin-antitoxin system RelE/ParE family toxin [Opitutaceae bacterium]|nr:type II toxin-antitoxin system RelE/ParE family toxin [Opitutaceae bacterium]
MALQLKWTKRASDQLDEIGNYIKADNPAAARREILGIIERAEILLSFPEMGRVYRRTPRAEYREIVVGNYRVLYLIKTAFQRIDIVTVWHGARGEPDIS